MLRGCWRAWHQLLSLLPRLPFLAALPLGSFGVLSIASLMHRYGSAVLTCCVTVGVRVASAIVAVAATATLAVRPSGSFGVLGIASLTHRYSSAVLTRGVAASVRVASAMGAAAVTATLVALHFGSFGVLRIASLTHRNGSAVLTCRVALLACVWHQLSSLLPRLPLWRCCLRAALAFCRSHRSRIAGAQQSSRAVWLRACVASAIVAVAVTATWAVLSSGSFGVLSIASLTHRRRSAVLTRGVAAGVRGISYRRCCRDCHFGGAAFGQLWRSVDRLAHASLLLSSFHAQRGPAGVRVASAIVAVALTATLAVLSSDSFGVLSIASHTHR